VKRDPDEKKARGKRIKYTYDSLNRLVLIEDSRGSKETFEYDRSGNIIKASNANITYEFSYYKNRRLKEVKNITYGISIEYKYDSNGNKRKVEANGKKLVTYEYDKKNRLTKITNHLGERTEFSYNRVGLRQQMIYPNGIVAAYEYDKSKRLTNLRYKNNSGKSLKAFHYEYNRLGNLIKVIDDGSNIKEYNYDKSSRLTKVKNNIGKYISYGYDKTDNRTKMEKVIGTTKERTHYRYNKKNELIQSGEKVFQYDADGNMISKKDGNSLTKYAYDDYNAMTEIITPGKDNISYGYGPFGKRILKKIGENITIYVYEREDILWTMDGQGKTIAEYTHGPGFDKPISTRIKNKSYYFHLDRLGNIVFLTDADGNIVNRYSYDPFGRFKESKTSVENTYFFNGKQYDKESGLYYFRNRYYDPETGRFVQEDPMRFLSSQSNLYVYVKNNPLNWVDPLGLQSEWDKFCEDWEDLGEGVDGAMKWIRDPLGIGAWRKRVREDPGAESKEMNERLEKHLSPTNSAEKSIGARAGIAGVRANAQLHLGDDTFKLTNQFEATNNFYEATAYLRWKEKGFRGGKFLGKGQLKLGDVGGVKVGLDTNSNLRLEASFKPVTVKADLSEKGNQYQVDIGISDPMQFTYDDPKSEELIEKLSGGFGGYLLRGEPETIFEIPTGVFSLIPHPDCEK